MDIVTSGETAPDVVLLARALVLHDLEVTGAADPSTVSALEEAVATRRWWAAQWAEGRTYVAGLVAQDVQDALLDQAGRWPLCRHCEEGRDGSDPHALFIHPELGGPDPHWVCERSGTTVAPLGSL
jgi:hypothetical protein